MTITNHILLLHHDTARVCPWVREGVNLGIKVKDGDLGNGRHRSMFLLTYPSYNTSCLMNLPESIAK